MNIQSSQAVFVIGLFLYLAIRAVYQRRIASGETTVSRSTKRDRSLVFLVVLGQLVLPLVYLFTPWLNFANYPSLSMSVGLGALVWAAALWLFWRSHADLGRNWSVTLELRSGHRLVKDGVYRLVRHPMYASFLLFGAGQALLLPNWCAGCFVLFAVALMCIIRVPHEEAMMCEFFGQEYREYMKRTGGIIPRVRSPSIP